MHATTDPSRMNVDAILGRWKNELGADAEAYRNHVLRVIDFCTALHDGDRDQIVLAACFHDLGIWTDGTFDYLQPSVARARDYLREQGLEAWSDQIAAMIGMHHRIRRHSDPLVEAFRRSDLVDVSLGLVRFGLPAALVRDVRSRHPNAGFHKRLVRLACGWWVRHPLHPLPVLKW